MRKAITGLVVLGMVVGGMALVPKRVWTVVKASFNRIEHRIDEGMSDEQAEAVIREQVSELDGQVRSYHLAVGKLLDRYAEAQVKEENLEAELAGQKEILRRAGDLLCQRRNEFDVGGRRVAREEVAADAQVRLGRCKQLEHRLECQRKLVEQLKRAVEEGRSNLVQAQRMRQEMVVELEAMRARLETARARKEVNAVASSLKNRPWGTDSELARDLARFKARTREAEREADLLAAEAGGPAVLDWSGSGAGDQDVGEAIARFLNGDRGKGAGKHRQ